MAGLGAPDLERLLVVLASGDDETFGGVPIDALDVGSVAAKNLLLETAIEVPNADGAVVRTGREFRVRRAPAESLNYSYTWRKR